MNYLWGAIVLLIGIFFLISAIKKSNFIIYRILIARSKILWGDKVHTFYIIVGIILIGFSALFFFNVFQ